MKGRQYPPMWQQTAPWPKQPTNVPDLGWQSQASCADVHPEVSEQMVEATVQADVADVAATLCRTCPVRHACYDAGRQMRASGCWGGRVLAVGDLAPDQRRREAS